MNRRTFLATAAMAASAGFAGCSRDTQQDTIDGVPEPPVPSSRLTRDGWKKYDSWERAVYSGEVFLIGTVNAFAHTVKYENTETREQVRAATLGNFDKLLRAFFATRVLYDPQIDDIPIAGGNVIDRTIEQTREQFVEQMKNQGVNEVQAVGSDTMSIDSGETADLYHYRGSFSFDGVPISLVEGETLTIRGGSLPVDGWVAIWQHDDDTLVAGGAYPGEDFERQARSSITDAIDVTVTIDLGLEPQKYRDELFELVQAVG